MSRFKPANQEVDSSFSDGGKATVFEGTFQVSLDLSEFENKDLKPVKSAASELLKIKRKDLERHEQELKYEAFIEKQSHERVGPEQRLAIETEHDEGALKRNAPGNCNEFESIDGKDFLKDGYFSALVSMHNGENLAKNKIQQRLKEDTTVSKYRKRNKVKNLMKRNGKAPIKKSKLSKY